MHSHRGWLGCAGLRGATIAALIAANLAAPTALAVAQQAPADEPSAPAPTSPTAPAPQLPPPTKSGLPRPTVTPPVSGARSGPKAGAGATVPSPNAAAGTIDASGPEIKLNGEIDLAKLVDLAAERLKFEVEYDASALKGTVTLRLRGGVTDAELWTLTNQLLASRGFTSVTPPGTRIVSIVKTAEAGASSRLERDDVAASEAGFVTLVTRIEHREVKDVVEAVKLVLSKPGGAIAPLGDTGFVLVSDLKPRIDQVMYVLDMLDQPASTAVVEIVPATNLKATELASLVSAAATTRDEIVGKKLRGKVVPLPDGSGVALTAPSDDVATWRELIAQFDQRQEVQTESYVPKHFSAADVASLIEKSVRDTGPRGAGDRWKLVVDELTSTIILTATPAEHEAVSALMDRLDSTSSGSRRQIRTFVVRNRPVKDVVDVLSNLIDAGVLIGGESAGKKIASGDGSTRRDVLPPGAQPVTPPGALNAVAGSGGASSSATQMTAPKLRTRRDEPAATSATLGAGGSRDDHEVTLTADVGMNTLLVVGEPRVIAQIEEILPTIDVRQPQVMLDVLFIGINDTDAMDLGIELQSVITSGQTKVLLASLFGLNNLVPEIGAPPVADTTKFAQGGTGIVINPGDYAAVVRALERISKGRALNKPRILVNNNEEATVTSVLQQPFSSTNASTTVATTAFGGTLDAGTMLTIRPQIAEGDHLILEYSVTVSAFVGKSTDPTLPPPRQNNTLDSIVTIPDGYTVVVGGVEVDTDAKGTSQVPGIGDVPVVGELFKSRSNSTERARFFVFLRASVLRHDGFEDLKYLSDESAQSLGIDDGWPVMEPRLIR